MSKNFKIFINADDFGLTKGINDGIVESARNGILNSVSLMVDAPATSNAILIIRENKGLFKRIGLHLNLVGNQGCKRPHYGYLTDSIGNYPERWSSLAKLIVKNGNKLLREIEIELRRQIEVLMSGGISLDHLDSHDHVHCFPKISTIVVRLAKEYNIPYVRCPIESVYTTNPTHFISPKYIAIAFFGNLLKSKIRSYVLNTSDHFFGLMDSGNLTKHSLLEILNQCGQGTSEIMCHPGFADKEIKRVFTETYNWDDEVSALTNPDVISLFNQMTS